MSGAREVGYCAIYSAQALDTKLFDKCPTTENSSNLDNYSKTLQITREGRREARFCQLVLCLRQEAGQSGKVHSRMTWNVPGHKMGNNSLEILPDFPCQRPQSA